VLRFLIRRAPLKFAKGIPASRVLVAAEIAWMAWAHLAKLDSAQRRRTLALLVKSRGRASNLSDAERRELAALVAALEPRLLVGSAARRLSPVPVPKRVLYGLYRFPVFGYFALSVAAAAMGNARGAIDDFAELAKVKVGQGSARTLAERSTTHAALAQAEASLRAAEALFDAAVQDAWVAAQGPDPVPVSLRAGLRIAATNAAATGASVVSLLFGLAGGPAVYDGSPLQRRFRDAHTASAHFQIGPVSREIQGRLLLDQPADTMMI
jgi:hypothetical protein